MPTLTPSLCPLLPSTLPPACHLPASLHGAPILAAIPPFLPLSPPPPSSPRRGSRSALHTESSAGGEKPPGLQTVSGLETPL
ncbi:hypothetical protein CgunFtcFv8_027812 [Champsocephalus gunnari]|uniref:Uncharacterized protein n=1 Tax=Champsocephalus gunnari TaxID=52237 RepID=A0AAN8E7G7_CHAGU|nr:hypothetical protein CgunFtcFv8_027812 [Champsocephalus gunnari]